MATKRKKAKKKKQITPEEKGRRKHIKDIQSLMQNIGFKRFPKVDGKQFQYNGRTTEIDDMFYCKNIIVIMEYTSGNPNNHLFNKKVFYDDVNSNTQSFLDYFLSNSIFASQSDVINNNLLNNYTKKQIQLRIVYASKQNIDEEHREKTKDIYFLDYPILKYFEVIAKTIKKTTLYEFSDFLNIKYDDLGDNIKQSGQSANKFEAQILPEEQSSFEAGCKIISFYIDANSLLSRAYVLRNDSWRKYNDFELLLSGKTFVTA